MNLATTTMKSVIHESNRSIRSMLSNELTIYLLLAHRIYGSDQREKSLGLILEGSVAFSPVSKRQFN